MGSLPGVKSLEAGQYYGHSRNHFWPLLALTTGTDFPALSYDERLSRLKAHNIGLWDVVAQASRPGSLDQHLRDIQPNILADFITTLPQLRAIAFNGATASRIGRRQLEHTNHSAITLLDMPSTSPANTMHLSAKAEPWRQIQDYIRI